MKNVKRQLPNLLKSVSVILLYCTCLQMVLVSPVVAQQSKHTVTGRVISSESGDGLAGVSVLEKGTKNGTITDNNGRYTLDVPKTGVLVFSIIGHEKQDVDLRGRSSVDVVMVPNVSAFNEVVVVGYGVQKRETLTGSIASIKGQVLEASPSPSLSNSLAGRLPGLVALNRSGEPGNDIASLLIRGSSTLGSTKPLIVIDGVPGREGISQINPRDIESVSILKDASAAIYGARAANGAILITTKRGLVGKPNISYSFNQGISVPTRIPKYADAATLAQFQNEQLAMQGQALKYTDDEIQKFRDGSDPLRYPNTDWVKSAIKDYTPVSQHSLSARGGTEVVRYFLSGNYSNQEGMFKDGTTNFKVLGGRSNVDVNITNNFKVALDISFQQQDRTLPGVGTGDILNAMWRNYPYLLDVFPNGLPGDGIERGDNPKVMASDESGYQSRKRNLYQTMVSFDYKVKQVPGLGFDGFVAYDKQHDFEKQFKKPYYLYSYDAASDTYNKNKSRYTSNPELTEKYTLDYNLTTNIKVKYQNTFDKHHLNAFAAMEFAEEKSDNFSASRRNFISTAIDQLFAGEEVNQVTSGGASEFARMNYLGRVSYEYAEKYLFDLNVRFDGTSAFPEDKRWGFFPGISVGWRMSEEGFIKQNAKFIDNLKIRGSWGKMGNDAVDPFQYLASYEFTGGYFLGGDRSPVKGVTQGVEPNRNITWEVANTFNVGLDADLWDGRFGVTVDVFKTRRSNILTERNASVPDYTGLDLPNENIGIVENKGFEIELRHRSKIGNVNYSISPNVSFARNKIIDIDEAQNAQIWQMRTGHPIGADLYYIPIGIYRSQEEIDNSPHPSGTTVNDLQYKDVNEDGKIDNKDRKRLNKTNTPEIIFGTQISVGYQGFDMAILLQGQANAWRDYWIPQGLFGNVLEEMVKNRPTAKNPNSKYPNITYDNSQVSAFDSEFWLRDASFLRLKSLELGYRLPSGILNKVGIKDFRIYVNAFNMFTIDKLKWFDPEGDQDRGQFYPQNKIFNLGFNITL